MVSGSCHDEVEVEVQKRDRERIEVFWNPVMLSGRGGGAALLTRAAWRRF
jgi:hypothetical protein